MIQLKNIPVIEKECDSCKGIGHHILYYDELGNEEFELPCNKCKGYGKTFIVVDKVEGFIDSANITIDI